MDLRLGVLGQCQVTSDRHALGRGRDARQAETGRYRALVHAAAGPKVAVFGAKEYGQTEGRGVFQRTPFDQGRGQWTMGIADRDTSGLL